MNISPGFFCDRDVGEYTIISAPASHGPAGRQPRDLLPSAQTMILFGMETNEDLGNF